MAFLFYNRAGNSVTKLHFLARLQRQREKQKNLRDRLGSNRNLNLDDQWKYFESWIPQAIHVLCQTNANHTLTSISNHLKIDKSIVKDAIESLIDLKILKLENGSYKSIEDFIHAPKNSPFTKRLHINWRQKIINDLTSKNLSQGLHFSGVASMDAETESKIQALLIESLEKAKSEIASSPSEKIYALAIDYYEI